MATSIDKYSGVQWHWEDSCVAVSRYGQCGCNLFGSHIKFPQGCSLHANSVSGCDLSVAAHASHCKGDWAGCVRMGCVCGISGDLLAIVFNWGIIYLYPSCKST